MSLKAENLSLKTLRAASWCKQINHMGGARKSRISDKQNHMGCLPHPPAMFKSAAFHSVSHSVEMREEIK